MITNEFKDKAIETLKKVLQSFHEKRFEDILSVVSKSKIENPEKFLSEFMQGTLELNDFETIDEYGKPCSFKPKYEYSQLRFYEYDNKKGFALEYDMTSNSDLVDMVLQLEFLYLNNGVLESIFENVDPQ